MKIIVVTKNWLGDILFQIPAIELIKAEYPEADITCVAPARCREILEALPAVNKVFVFDEKKEHRSFLSRIFFGLSLRNEKWDKAFLLHKSKTRALITWLAGARERYGYKGGRRMFLTKSVREPSGPIHQVDYYLHLLREVGLKAEHDGKYRFYVSKQSEQAVDYLLAKQGLQPKRYVAFHLGANWEPKRWPVKHFAELADKIYQEWKIPIVVTGASGDLPLVHELQGKANTHAIVSFVAQTTLEETAVIFKNAACLITGDSGPMHIASGIDTPVVALFGPTSAELTGPRGIGKSRVISFVPEGYHSPWYGQEFPEEGWLSQILPARVFSELKNSEWLSDLPEAQSLKLLKKESKAESARNGKSTMEILFVTLTNIGDVVLTTPVLMALKNKFPHSNVTVVAGPKAKNLLIGSRYVDRLIPYDKKAPFSEKKEFLHKLREIRYDLAVDLRNSAIPVLVKAKKKSPLVRRYKKVSMRERHLEVLKMMGLPTEATKRFDFYNQQDELQLDQIFNEHRIDAIDRFVLVAPAAASELKTWYLEGFESVIKKILEETDEKIILIGDKRERLIAQPLVDLDPSRIFNFAGTTTLREVAALISRSSLLLTNDSAVMHMGYEMERPVVAVFGPTDPQKYGHQGPVFRMLRSPELPELSGKTIHRGDRDYFFKGLDPEEVYAACKELMYEQSVTV